MFKDLAGKDVFENKIEAIKALRTLAEKIEINLSTESNLDGTPKREFKLYLSLKLAKDMVESCMALGVIENHKRMNEQVEGRFIRPSVSSNNVYPQYITDGQMNGYLTHYTFRGALSEAVMDKSIERITIKEGDGSEHVLYRNSKQQTFELDII